MADLTDKEKCQLAQQGRLGWMLIRDQCESHAGITGDNPTAVFADSCANGEVAAAAVAYLTSDIAESVDFFWPFAPDDFEPTPHDRIAELVKAGALVAAEIDRLGRQMMPAPAHHPQHESQAEHDAFGPR